MRRRIFVQTLDGQRVPVDVEDDEAVDDIPMKVFEKEPFLQRFATVASPATPNSRGPAPVDPCTGETRTGTSRCRLTA